MHLAVVVTFYPDAHQLLKNLRSIAKQVDKVLVIDNGSGLDASVTTQIHLIESVRLLALVENKGLGYAINAGIHEAKRLDAKYVLLFDQDSHPLPFMVTQLIKAYGDVKKRKLAAIGPRFIDSDSGAVSQHIQFETTRIGRIPCPESAPYVRTDFLITSGSLIPLHVLDDIGPMDESLFIDHIDTEWCLRAKSKGYELLGDCEALMEHDLGEYRKRIWFLRWREVPVHKPFRYYYIFRNSVLLYRRDYIPWAWKRIDMIRLVQIVGFTVIFGPQRFQKIRMMLRGVFDGLRGKSGRLDG